MRESVLFDEDPAVLVRPPVESLSGELFGMDLPAFLQLLEMERKACTVLVRDEDRTGTLVFDRGALIHARRGGSSRGTSPPWTCSARSAPTWSLGRRRPSHATW